VTPFIHPEAVFMLHGFGSEIPLKTRSFGKGLSDNRLETGLLEKTDPVGGGIAFLECMVSVKKS
jgi:thiosulfate reductase/polysulfide reductase chain A